MQKTSVPTKKQLYVACMEITLAGAQLDNYKFNNDVKEVLKEIDLGKKLLGSDPDPTTAGMGEALFQLYGTIGALDTDILQEITLENVSTGFDEVDTQGLGAVAELFPEVSYISTEDFTEPQLDFVRGFLSVLVAAQSALKTKYGDFTDAVGNFSDVPILDEERAEVEQPEVIKETPVTSSKAAHSILDILITLTELRTEYLLQRDGDEIVLTIFPKISEVVNENTTKYQASDIQNLLSTLVNVSSSVTMLIHKNTLSLNTRVRP